MRYSSMRNLDISNGEGVGVSLFVQGCPFHCKNCFNSDTWDFNGGKEWTEETKNRFLELIDRPYIKRVSLLGGECLAEQNLDGVLDLIRTIREKYPISQNVNLENPYKSRVLEPQNDKELHISFPEKTIWLYTGFRWNEIMNYKIKADLCEDNISFEKHIKEDLSMIKRKNIISNVNVLVDGEYIDEQKDLTLKWRGSKNQHVIDVKQSLAQNKTILYCD